MYDSYSILSRERWETDDFTNQKEINAYFLLQFTEGNHDHLSSLWKAQHLPLACISLIFLKNLFLVILHGSQDCTEDYINQCPCLLFKQVLDTLLWSSLTQCSKKIDLWKTACFLSTEVYRKSVWFRVASEIVMYAWLMLCKNCTTGLTVPGLQLLGGIRLPVEGMY